MPALGKQGGWSGDIRYFIVSKFDFFNKFLSFSEAECVSLEDGRCVTGLVKISRWLRKQVYCKQQVHFFAEIYRANSGHASL